MNCIPDYPLHVRIVKGLAGLVSGLEIKDLARAAKEAATASEDVSVLKPRAKHESIGLRNKEGLTIQLLFVKAKALGNAFCNGMSGHHIPYYLFLIASP